MLHRAAVTTPGQMGLVKEVLSLSDMVKFAKYVPESGLHETVYGDAQRFVEETRVPELNQEQESNTRASTENTVAGNNGTSGEKGGKNA